MRVLNLPVKDRSGAVFSAPEELSDALAIPFSDQQLAAITAPLEPGVIIAGAGSGKTTVMAARVVWLVGTGEVRPEEVLGLTFTRKAAAELSLRVRSALERAKPTPCATSTGRWQARWRPPATRTVRALPPSIATAACHAGNHSAS